MELAKQELSIGSRILPSHFSPFCDIFVFSVQGNYRYGRGYIRNEIFMV